MEPFACLYVEKGEPYQPGACLFLEADETVIGRPAQQAVPDIPFANAYISRRHAAIRREGGRVLLYDLGSKHGTEVSGEIVAPFTPFPLRTSDVIRLAGGMIVLRFSHTFADQTLELEPLTLPAEGLRIDRDRRLCYVNGEPIPMSDKEWRLLVTLQEREEALVSLEAIKRAVWPERAVEEGGVPDVGTDELSSLVYRLRKKMQDSGYQIQTIRGQGFLFERTGSR
ncbi:FHA domain-containing protein [Tumebacillus sp. DT12]|uniref:FHA domain-containing protein n=1 Tax=Tumebacillus lacus TaxID=2995335 RepID=A0ABT3WY76_9BACL|nr:FHA domain-containing protein [Tumebacillus lacus]MCX7568643.1 FHA domain-containing protein [Tumebacillus lacus]